MRWYVNWKFDTFFFFLPYWICWVLFFYFTSGDANLLSFGMHTPFFVWLIVEVFLDGGHAWLTLYRTFWDKSSIENHGVKFLLGILAFCFFILFFLSLWSVEITMRFLFYSSLYHGVKQLFGITSLYFAKNINSLAPEQKPTNEILAKVRKWDTRVLIATFYIPFLYWHFHMTEDVPFLTIAIPGDYLIETLVPKSLQGLDWNLYFNVLFYLSFFAPILYWLYLNLFKFKNIQWVKIVWTLTNSATFYMIFVAAAHEILISGGLLVVHAIAYFGIVALYQFRKEQKKIKDFLPKYFLGLLPILFFAVVQIFLIQNFVVHEHEIGGEYIKGIDESIYSQPYLTAFVIALLFVINLSHYVYDAYVWKFNSKNPHLKKLLL